MRRSATRSFSWSCSSPKIAILDETDSGLDVDALRVVSEGVNRVRESGEVGTLLITHYTRILRYIKPDHVHVFAKGRIAESGGPELADKLEEEGYEAVREGWRHCVTRDAPGSAGHRGDPQGLPDPGPPVHDGQKLVYLDNAATSQKPRQVLDALSDYYERHNANVHRGVHVLAEEATALYEGARDKVAAFINAPSRDEVVFTKNASESLNLVANMLGWADEPYRVERDTEIVITEMEHHSNIVPWQLLSQRTGAKLKWFGLTDEGRLDLSGDRGGHHREDQGRLASRWSPTSWAPSTPSRTSSGVPRRSARWSSWTPRRRPRTWCWTCRRSRPTSSPSPGTRCAVRPASACCGGARSCWTTCRRSSAAAR